MDLTEYERMVPHMKVDGITFITPNSQCAWRVETLYTKEPDTIEWIRRMKPNEWLYDIGACMGGYSLYAASRGLNVMAFEPESQNFALLCRNIAINNFGDRILAWPLGVAEKSGWDIFHVGQLMPGNSCNSLGVSVNYHLQPKEFAFKHGVGSICLNDFCEGFPTPDHIKIDVDGLEHKILAGGGGVFPDVKSVLIELNTALLEHQKMFELMEDWGFKPDMATAEKARRTEGPFKGVGNVIFFRNEADFLSK